MTKIKICGLTRFKDAMLALSMGADFLGMVFYEKSKRLCSINVAQWITQEASLISVLVFGYDSYQRIVNIISLFPLHKILIQVPSDHPSLSDLAINFTSAKIILSVSVQETLNDQTLARFEKFYAVILDTGGQKDEAGNILPGGTGVTFDWTYLKNLKTKYFLAGGLSNQNIQIALNSLDPYGVDISSGLEEKLGKKNFQKLDSFIKQVKKHKKQ